MEDLRRKVEEAVRQAGEMFHSACFNSEGAVMVKGTANYVTQVDFMVQDFLVDALTGIIPGSNVITEESDKNRFTLEDSTWILDPVDGTTNLMYGYKHSAISLALYLDGRSALAFIYNPDTREMFWAQAGKGAFMNSERIAVGESRLLEDCLIAFGTTPYDRSDNNTTFKVVEKAFKSCRDVRRTGSAALDIAYVACGRIDGFFELFLQTWDYAAGILLLEEAGGKITDWKGEPLSVLSPGGVLATNGFVHAQLLKILNE